MRRRSEKLAAEAIAQHNRQRAGFEFSFELDFCCDGASADSALLIRRSDRSGTRNTVDVADNGVSVQQRQLTHHVVRVQLCQY
jgi:hypothetical protein